MSWYILFLIFVLGLFLLLSIGYWVPFALGTVGILGLLLVSGKDSLNSLGLTAWNSLNSFELTAIPLFVFMGEIILRSGISKRFFENTSNLIKFLPGGLLQTNIISSAFFAAVSGSSSATVATVGSVSIPEMKNRGYDRSMVYGSLGGGGALGYLIPPSTALIIYGAIVQESVAKLFLAGIIPGVIATLIFMVYIAIRCQINNDLVPKQIYRKSPITLNEVIRNIFGILPVLTLILIVLGGIYLGYATPTESASLGVIMSFILALIYKELNISSIKGSLVSTVRTTSMIMFIILGANILSNLIVQSGINWALTSWIISVDPSPFVFLFIVILIYLILGTIIDGLSMIFLTLPILFPLVDAMGFDAIWFGIVLVILIEIDQITPPLCINLFISQIIAGKDVKLGEIVKGNIPYFFLYLLLLIMIIVFQKNVLWLPSHM